MQLLHYLLPSYLATQLLSYLVTYLLRYLVTAHTLPRPYTLPLPYALALPHALPLPLPQALPLPPAHTSSFRRRGCHEPTSLRLAEFDLVL